MGYPTSIVVTRDARRRRIILLAEAASLRAAEQGTGAPGRRSRLIRLALFRRWLPFPRCSGNPRVTPDRSRGKNRTQLWQFRAGIRHPVCLDVSGPGRLQNGVGRPPASARAKRRELLEIVT
jgi:hypothetical protein